MRIRSSVVGALVVLAGCKSEKHPTEGAAAPTPPAVAPASIVAVDGSSTVFPISEAVAEEYQAKHTARVTVAVSGTGGGFKKFCRGEIAVTGASRPIKASETEACAAKQISFVELPVAYDGLAVVVHKENSWVDHLTVAELKAMWAPEAQGKVTRWNQVREGFPDRELHLFGAGVDSGTYDYFTHAIVGKEHSSRGDYTSSEDDNVLVQGVASDAQAIGFFGFAYYAENKERLKLVPIDDGNDGNGKGAIAPSLHTVADGTYQPLSRPIFIYVSVAALAQPAVQEFAAFYLQNAATLSQEVGYIALSAQAYALATNRLQQRRTGSLFQDGSKVGAHLEEMLAAP